MSGTVFRIQTDNCIILVHKNKHGIYRHVPAMLPTIERSLYVGLDPSSEGCRRHADAVDSSVFEACRLVVQQLAHLPGRSEGWLGVRDRSETSI